MNDAVLNSWLLGSYLVAFILCLAVYAHCFLMQKQATRKDLLIAILVSLCPMLNIVPLLFGLYMLVFECVEWDTPIWTRHD